ncbi:MAG: DUF6265 family protein [Ferruginibacter sp.]
MKKLLYIFLVTAASCSGDQKETGPSIKKFSWLNGAWIMEETGGNTTEDWITVNDSLMTGKSDFIKGDSVIPFETIRIYKNGPDFYYEAKAAGQNNEQPVAFKIIRFSDSAFVAENPAHDFPKRIGYKMIRADSVVAFIDDGAAAPLKKAEFYYRRNKK